MARIRTIKPEFWTSEQVMECQPLSRLLFIGIWNFCDDAGNHPVSDRTIKALVFPGDDVDSAAIRRMLVELSDNGLITFYEHSGKQYLHVNGWQHQKIDKPTIKHPAFTSDNAANGDFNEGMRPVAQVVGEDSTSNRLPLDHGREGEGKGKGNGSKEPLSPNDDEKPANKIPYQQIADLYNRVCGDVLPKCVALNDKRRTSIRSLWNMSINGVKPFRDLEFWEGYFNDCLTNKHWTGGNDRGWRADIDFLTTQKAALKALEAA